MLYLFFFNFVLKECFLFVFCFIFYNFKIISTKYFFVNYTFIFNLSINTKNENCEDNFDGIGLRHRDSG